MSKLFQIALLIGLLVAPLSTVSQTVIQAPYLKKQFANTHPIPHSTEITDIAEDENLNKWICTLNGLYKFDGEQLSEYDGSYPVGREFILMDRCSDDNLWFLSFSQGLCKLDQDTLVAYPFNHLLKRFSATGRVVQFDADAEGNLYFGVRGRGVFRIDHTGRLDTLFAPKAGQCGVFIARLPTGKRINFASNLGKFMCEGDNQLYILDDTYTASKSYPLERNLLSQHLSTLVDVEYRDSIYFIALDEPFIYRVEGDEISIIDCGVDVRELEFDRSANLWCGGEGGLYRIANSQLQLTNPTLEPSVRSGVALFRCEDAFRKIWYVDKSSNLHWLEVRVFEITVPQESLGPRSQPIHIERLTDSSMLIASGRNIYTKYCGSAGNAPLQRGVIQSSEHPTSFEILDVLHREGNTWISGYFGLKRIAGAHAVSIFWPKGVIGLPDHLFSGYKTRQMEYIGTHHLIASTGHYIYEVRNDSVIRSMPYSDIEISDFCYTKNREILLVKAERLYRIQKDSLATSKPSLLLPQLRVRFVLQVLEKTVVLTTDNELFELENESLERIPVELSEVYTLNLTHESKDQILLTGAFGALTFTLTNPNESTLYLVHPLRKHGNAKNAVVELGGFYYMAGEGGVFGFAGRHFKSKELTALTPASTLRCAEFGLRTLGGDAELEIDHDQPLIQFSLHDTYNPHVQRPVVYRYRLNDGDWVELALADIVLTNLQHGDYLLRVQSRYRGLPWAEPQRLSFTVVAPLWQRWWFYLLLGLAMAVISIGLRYHFYRIKERELKLTIEKNVLEQRALRAQLNPHFLNNAFNNAIELSSKGDNLRTSEFLSSLSLFFRSILDASFQTLSTLHDELNLYREYLEIEKRIKGACFEFQVEVGQEVDVQHIRVPSLVIQPLIENALVHGIAHQLSQQKRGLLYLSFEQLGNQLHIAVCDNGPGLTQEKLMLLNQGTEQRSGLRITRNRLNMYSKVYHKHHSIRFGTSAELGGTCVELTFELI